MGSRYYAGSDPVRWLRTKLKVNKPTALGWGEWEKWEADLKKERPIAYFLTETLPDWVEWIPNHTIEHLNTLRTYFINRFVTKTHCLKTDLKPGKWHELDQRILHGCFTELVNFVEIEKASKHVTWSDEKDTAKYKVPIWRKFWPLRWTEWRNAQCGVDYLRWEISLAEPDETGAAPSSHQAAAAGEILMLYNWWVHVRPAREEPWQATGFQKFWDEMDAKYGDGKWLGFNGKKVMTPAESRKYNKLSKAADALEEERMQEDEDMLIRLIKLRRNLWT